MAVEARPWASSLRRVSIVLISCEGFIAAILSGANRCRLTLIDEADWTLGFDPVFGGRMLPQASRSKPITVVKPLQVWPVGLRAGRWFGPNHSRLTTVKIINGHCHFSDIVDI